MNLLLSRVATSCIVIAAAILSGCSTKYSQSPTAIINHNDVAKLKGRTLESIESEFGHPDYYGYDRYPIIDHIIPDSFYTLKYARYHTKEDDQVNIEYDQVNNQTIVIQTRIFKFQSYPAMGPNHNQSLE